MSAKSNLPRVRLWAASSRSPWSTWMVTAGWLSAAVEKIWLLRVGTVVLRSMSLVITPPRVSMPRERGVTSSRSTSLTASSPASTPACTAAPTATTSSGFTPLWGSLPPNSSLTLAWTAGMRVEPPTRMTSSIWETVRPASLRAWVTGRTERSTRAWVRLSNLARVSVSSRCLGPVASAVMKGRLMEVLVVPERSILAFSAASLMRCRAILSLRRSTRFSFRNSSATQLMMASSKLSPPRWVSPLVLLTSKTPSPISRMEMSKVPPPRSYTAMVSFLEVSLNP